MTTAAAPPAPPPTSFAYEVARHRPDEMRADLCRLWTENLPVGATAEERFRWLYVDGVRASAEENEEQAVFMLRAKDKSGDVQVVGTSGLTARRFQIGERYGRAGLNGDLAVDKMHRGLLPALRLMKAACEHERKSFDVAYGFPNIRAVGVLLRSGFRELDKMTRYVRVLRHAAFHRRLSERPGIPPIVARVGSNAAVAHAVGPVVDVARLAVDTIPIVKARRHFKLEWSTHFDERFDALWEAARGQYNVVAARTSSFLAWRCPKPEIAILKRRSNNELRAYAIIERDEMTGAAHLRDLFGHKDDLPALVDLLLTGLWRRDAVSISVRFLGAPYLLEAINARGFKARPEQRTVTMVLGERAAADRARLEDPRAWHIFDIDEDA